MYRNQKGPNKWETNCIHQVEDTHRKDVNNL